MSQPGRRCTGCGAVDPTCGFYKQGKHLTSRCRECIRSAKRLPRICLGCGDTYYRIGSSGARRRLCDKCAQIGKVCPRCDTFKPLDSFYGTPTAMGGNRYCKDGCSLAANRESKYGITRSEHEALSRASANGCVICGAVGRRMALDHDHDSGAFRQIICGQCNSGLGMFGDSVDTLLGAVAYLKRHSARS